MYRGAYGVLHLLPWDFGRLTPGEYCDLLTARSWAKGQRTEPLRGAARAQENAKFDALMAERRARG